MSPVSPSAAPAAPPHRPCRLVWHSRQSAAPAQAREVQDGLAIAVIATSGMPSSQTPTRVLLAVCCSRCPICRLLGARGRLAWLGRQRVVAGGSTIASGWGQRIVHRPVAAAAAPPPLGAHLAAARQCRVGRCWGGRLPMQPPGEAVWRRRSAPAGGPVAQA